MPRSKACGGEAGRHDGEGEQGAESTHGGEAYPRSRIGLVCRLKEGV
jgi:hypothetical protein